MRLHVRYPRPNSSFREGDRNDAWGGVRGSRYRIIVEVSILIACTSDWRVVRARRQRHVIWLAVACPEVAKHWLAIRRKLVRQLAAHIVVALNLHFLHAHGLKPLPLIHHRPRRNPPLLQLHPGLPFPGVHDAPEPLLVRRSPRQLVDVPLVVPMLLQLAHVALRVVILDSEVFWNSIVFLPREAVIPARSTRHPATTSRPWPHLRSMKILPARLLLDQGAPRRQAQLVVVARCVVLVILVIELRYSLRLLPVRIRQHHRRTSRHSIMYQCSLYLLRVRRLLHRQRRQRIRGSSLLVVLIMLLHMLQLPHRVVVDGKFILL